MVMEEVVEGLDNVVCIRMKKSAVFRHSEEILEDMEGNFVVLVGHIIGVR
jgi:hypothetical protein